MNYLQCTWPERKPMGRKPKNKRTASDAFEGSPASLEHPVLQQSVPYSNGIFPSSTSNYTPSMIPSIQEGAISTPMGHFPAVSVPYNPALTWAPDVQKPAVPQYPPLQSDVLPLKEPVVFDPVPGTQPERPSQPLVPQSEVGLASASSQPPPRPTPDGIEGARTRSALAGPSSLPEGDDPITVSKLCVHQWFLLLLSLIHKLTHHSSRVDVYYSIPHLYLPMLPPKSEFLVDTELQSPLLLNSMFALAAPYASFPIVRDYRAIAHDLLERVDPPSLAPTSMRALHYIQSLLMLTYLEFGRANIPKAVELCARACEIAQRLGWNTFDAGIPPPSVNMAPVDVSASPTPSYSTGSAGSSPDLRTGSHASTASFDHSAPQTPGTSVSSSSLRSTAPPQHPAKPTSTNITNALMMSIRPTSTPRVSEDPMARRIRLAWWECWVVDIMMSVTCRQKRNLAGVMISVHLPNEPPCLKEVGCPIVWVSFGTVSLQDFPRSSKSTDRCLPPF